MTVAMLLRQFTLKLIYDYIFKQIISQITALETSI